MLAKMGKRVVAIDLDPQANLTSAFRVPVPGKRNSSCFATRSVACLAILHFFSFMRM